MAKKQFTSFGSRTIPAKRLLGTAISLVVFFLLLASVIRLADKYLMLRERNKELKNSHAELVEKEKSLSATNMYLSTDEGIEQSIRERYNYIRPGEELILLTSETVVSEPEEKRGVAHWWDQLLRGIGFRKD